VLWWIIKIGGNVELLAVEEHASFFDDTSRKDISF
jgi:hypothetical protein